jgi:hypothetical protein
MKTSLLRTLVCIALFAFAIAVAAWQIERVQIGRDWNNVGGGYTKNLLPLTGWEFVWIGGAAGDRVPTSLQELNSRLQAITSLPRCKTLRIYSEVLTEINTAKPDSESLQALLRACPEYGTCFADSVSLSMTRTNVVKLANEGVSYEFSQPRFVFKRFKRSAVGID